ncbi:hypothetical protein JW756_04960 [Candidatus Woesearchaeota archaeon]|nr:hypothetical protein [Candidatus Woesearchaeota archaeon]
MKELIIWIVGFVLWLVAIPLIALLIRLLAEWMKFKDKSYKTALKASAIISAINYAFIFLSYFLLYNHPVVHGLLTLVVTLFAWFITIKRMYKLEVKQALKFLLFYILIGIGITIIVIGVSFIVLTFTNKISASQIPGVITSACFDKCSTLSDTGSVDINMADGNFTCLCNTASGEKILGFVLPVDFDWKGLEKNLSETPQP